MNEGEYLELVNDLRDQYNDMKEKYEKEISMLKQDLSIEKNKFKFQYLLVLKLKILPILLVCFCQREEMGILSIRTSSQGMCTLSNTSTKSAVTAATPPEYRCGETILIEARFLLFILALYFDR